MTKIVNGVLFIEQEKDGKCELCGSIAELRPYGPNGEMICYECGIKDMETTIKQINKFFDQLKPINPDMN